MPPAATAELELAAEIAEYVHDPLGFCEVAFPWGTQRLQAEGPRLWQREELRMLGEHLQKNPFAPYVLTISSGNGIGKSAFMGMLSTWGLSTCTDTRIALTANTGPQLKTKTWPEITKWFQLCATGRWFDVHAESIRSKDPKHANQWRMDRVTWTENNTEAFQGLHNVRRRIIVLMDEASGIPDKIWEVTDPVLTDADTEIIWVRVGNPTRNTGRFRESFGRFANIGRTRQIDSRTVEGTNKELYQLWVDSYGEDSDYVRTHVRGEFPRAGTNQFIPSDLVAAARRYQAQGYSELPKVLAADVARFGDDQTVIGVRQGRQLRILEKLRGKDTVFVAERIIHWREQEKPDAVIVDGDGLGAGVVDQIRHRGYGAKLFEFHGGLPANDAAAYFNRRAEVWGMMRDWLAAGAQIPDDPEMEEHLTGLEYGFSSKSQIQLERKEDMKKRGLASPDCGDMLAMTFAVKVAPPKKPVDDARPVRISEANLGWMS